MAWFCGGGSRVVVGTRFVWGGRAVVLVVGAAMARNMALGARGEDVAVEFLIDAGLEIVERNWRCRYGELDVVATSGDRIVFVEVKTRSGVGYGSPAESVTFAKQRRIRVLAMQWLADSGRSWSRVRFDVVAVLIGRDGEPSVEHFVDAF